MKKLIILLLIATFGCTEMLDQPNPVARTGDDFFQNETDVQLAVVATYAALTRGSELWARNMYALEQVSDNTYNGSGDGGSWYSFEITPEDGLLNGFYHSPYIGINRANQVLLHAPSISGIAQANLDNYLGQVYFLRAYFYFFLTSLFGDVPIVLEPPRDPAGFTPAASPASEVYNQIISDLELAEQLLPADASEAGRVVSMTATAMLAKVYLFGADELNEPSWFALAQQKAEEVIASGKYGLLNDPSLTPEENFMAVFSTVVENTEEDIFTVMHYNDGSTRGNSNIAGEYQMAVNPRYNRNFNAWGFGWAYVYESVLTQWDPADARRSVSLWEDGEEIYLDDVLVGTYEQESQSRPYVRPDGGGIQKFWWSENFKRNNPESDLNMRVIRYAEMLLIHAEADLMADGTISTSGLASMNEVRDRAGLPALAASEVDRQAILDERRWELFGEAHRWFDLVRTRTAEDAFAVVAADDTNNNDRDHTGFVPERFYKMPYPQSAIDRNKALVQKSVWASAE